MSIVPVIILDASYPKLLISNSIFFVPSNVVDTELLVLDVSADCTPLIVIVLAVSNLVALEALPSNAPLNLVA